MHKRLLQVLALAVCLGLLPAAYAKGGGSPDKGKSSNDHERDKHHNDNDRDDHHTGRGNGHEHEAAAGPANRPPGWDKGNKTGWGDCNVPPGLAKQRGCDSSGFSARERTAHRNPTVATRSATASTNRPVQPGQTRGIILQRNGSHTAATASTSRPAQAGERGGIILQRSGSQSTTRTTTATTASTPKAAQAGQTRGIILQRGASKAATQKSATVQK